MTAAYERPPCDLPDWYEVRYCTGCGLAIEWSDEARAFVHVTPPDLPLPSAQTYLCVHCGDEIPDGEVVMCPPDGDSTDPHCEDCWDQCPTCRRARANDV